MKKLFHSFINPTLRKRSLLFIIVSIVLIMISALITLSNNIPGLICLLLAIISGILAFINHWKYPKNYLYLAIYAVVVFIISVILHNLCEAVAQNYTSNSILSYIMNSIGVVFFFVAILFCPAAFIVGIIGSFFLFLKNKFSNPKNDYK